MAQRMDVDGGRRAWTLVVTLGLTETTSYGVLYYAFTVFLTPMQAELGWSRSALTGAFSLALLFSGVVGLLVGRWLDSHGPSSSRRWATASIATGSSPASSSSMR